MEIYKRKISRKERKHAFDREKSKIQEYKKERKHDDDIDQDKKNKVIKISTKIFMRISLVGLLILLEYFYRFMSCKQNYLCIQFKIYCLSS